MPKSTIRIIRYGLTLDEEKIYFYRKHFRKNFVNNAMDIFDLKKIVIPSLNHIDFLNVKVFYIRP